MRSLLKQISWVTSGQIVAAALQLVLFVSYARAVPPNIFGLTSVVLGVGVAMQAVADLGMSRLIIREHAMVSQRTGFVTTALRINGISTMLLVLFGITALGSVALFVDAFWFLMLPLALACGLEKNAETWTGIAIADGKSHLASTNLVLRRFVALGTFSVLTWISWDAVLSFSVGLAAGAAVSVVFARSVVARLMTRTDRVSSRLVVAEAIPYLVNSVSVQMRNLDVYLVTSVNSAATGGLYASARRLLSPLLLLPTAMATVLLPAIARSPTTVRAYVLRSITLTSCAAMPIYVGIALLLPWALPLALGEPYRDATPAAQVLVLALPLSVAGSLLTSYQQGQGQARVTARIAVISTAYNLGGIWLGATLGGLIGAAIATATTSAVQVVLQVGWFLRNSSKVDPINAREKKKEDTK